MSIRIVLADDHNIVLEGIKAIIERKAKKDIEIIGLFSNGKDVLAFARPNPADIYILDISMPILNGIDTTIELKKIAPKSRIILLSMHDDRNLVQQGFESGAHGYILKESATQEIITAIYEVYNNRFYISPKISSYIIEGFLNKSGHLQYSQDNFNLTQREKEVLRLMTEGLNTRNIAARLNISVPTVFTHKNNIMKKLDIHSQAGLIRYALKEGIAL